MVHIDIPAQLCRAADQLVVEVARALANLEVVLKGSVHHLG